MIRLHLPVDPTLSWRQIAGQFWVGVQFTFRVKSILGAVQLEDRWVRFMCLSRWGGAPFTLDLYVTPENAAQLVALGEHYKALAQRAQPGGDQ